MHTFTVTDKDKLDILWSLFQQLKGQVAFLINQVAQRPASVYNTITDMQNDPQPWVLRVFQTTQPGSEHQYWFDPSSNATPVGISILISNVTAQGRFIQLL